MADLQAQHITSGRVELVPLVGLVTIGFTFYNTVFVTCISVIQTFNVDFGYFCWIPPIVCPPRKDTLSYTKILENKTAALLHLLRPFEVPHQLSFKT